MSIPTPIDFKPGDYKTDLKAVKALALGDG